MTKRSISSDEEGEGSVSESIENFKVARVGGEDGSEDDDNDNDDDGSAYEHEDDGDEEDFDGEEEGENEDDGEDGEEEGGEGEEEGEDDDESEYDREETARLDTKLPEVNSEELYIPLLYRLSDIQAYVNLIKNSPNSKVIKFESGYRPRKLIVNAVCEHGKFTTLELEQGDWEAWISRFPRILKSLPNLERVIIAGASQSGCGEYDTMMLCCLDLPKLVHLDVSNNGEDMGQCPVLARLILEHGNLKSIVMGENEYEDGQEQLVVEAIRDAAKAKKLVLEELDGLTLNEPQWREILELPTDEGDEREEVFAAMSNQEILAYLKTAY